jgi:hypothetical protein
VLEDKDLVNQIENLILSAKQQRSYYKINPEKEFLQLYFLKLRESLEIIVQERLSRETGEDWYKPDDANFFNRNNTIKELIKRGTITKTKGGNIHSLFHAINNTDYLHGHPEGRPKTIDLEEWEQDIETQIIKTFNDLFTPLKISGDYYKRKNYDWLADAEKMKREQKSLSSIAQYLLDYCKKINQDSEKPQLIIIDIRMYVCEMLIRTKIYDLLILQEEIIPLMTKNVAQSHELNNSLRACSSSFILASAKVEESRLLRIDLRKEEADLSEKQAIIILEKFHEISHQYGYYYTSCQCLNTLGHIASHENTNKMFDPVEYLCLSFTICEEHGFDQLRAIACNYLCRYFGISAEEKNYNLSLFFGDVAIAIASRIGDEEILVSTKDFLRVIKISKEISDGL